MRILVEMFWTTTMKLKNKKIVELDNRVNQIKIDAKVRSRYMTLKEWLDDMVEQEVDFIREKIKEQVEEEVREQVEEEVRERVEEEVRERVKEEVRERVEEVRQEGKIEGQTQLLRKFYIKGYNVEKTAELIEVEENFVNEVYEVLQKYPEYDDEKIVTMYIQKRKEYNNN